MPELNQLNDRRPNSPSAVNNPTGLVRMLGEICDAFGHATGWSMRYIAASEIRKDPFLKWSAPVNPGVRTALGHLGMDLSAPSRKPVPPDPLAACRLAESIADLASRLATVERCLRNREAELACGVPVVLAPQQPDELASRFEEILCGAARACDCQAAALYMLDDATTELKLRACCGLPSARLQEPARPLADAVADLEALLGHAVVLERAASFGPWKAPEEFPSAMCVPVSSPTTPLGTLWMFCDRERDFTDQHTLIAEMTAGRLAAELERTILATALAKLNQAK